MSIKVFVIIKFATIWRGYYSEWYKCEHIKFTEDQTALIFWCVFLLNLKTSFIFSRRLVLEFQEGLFFFFIFFFKLQHPSKNKEAIF